MVAASPRPKAIILFEAPNDTMSAILSILKQVVEQRQYSDHGQVKYGQSMVYKFWRKVPVVAASPEDWIKKFGYTKDILYRPELLELVKIISDRDHYEVKTKYPIVFIKPGDPATQGQQALDGLGQFNGR
jgi:hypothetical protein